MSFVPHFHVSPNFGYDKYIMFSSPKIDAYLFGCALFRNLSEGEQQEVARLGWRRKVAADEFFYRQGDPAGAFYVLLEGRAKLTKVTLDGHQILARFLDPGECFGVVAAQQEAEYPLSVQAVESCVAEVWDTEALVRLMKRYPSIALNALQVMTQQCQGWQRRYEELATKRVEQRIAQAVVRLARQAGRRVQSGVLIDLPLSRQDMAEMTSTTIYTVSRILSRWETEELVELGRERVVIRQGHRLVEIAEALETD